MPTTDPSTSEPRRLSLPRRLLAHAAMFGLIVFAGAAWFWFQSSGTGEYETSPDGRFTAHASNLVRGTLRGRVSYVELRIEEADTMRVLWNIEYQPRPNTAPDYGERRNDPFIVWADDSSTAAFPIGGGRTIVVPLPPAKPHPR